MRNFHDVRIPDFIERQAQGGPIFNTYCVSTSSGREHRYVNWSYPLQKYIVNNCYLSIDQLEQLNSFFRARQGMAFAFRMKDYADYSIKRQPLSWELIVDNKFQLVKSYAGGNNRKITKPTDQSIEIQDENDQDILFTADYSTGIITLTDDLFEKQLYVSCEFDVPVRFNSDALVYNITPEQAVIVNNLEFIEVM